MKKLFKKKKRSVSEVGSLASLSHSGYDISPKKDLTKLHKAAYEGDLTKLKSLLKKADVNELDKEKRTALHLACANGKIDVIKMLTDHPKINLDLCDKEERTALMKCVQCEFPRCLEILLRKGAATNRQDVNGNTALHLSISIPNAELTILLLDYGIDIETKNNDGNTPLHVATSVDVPAEIIRTLISDGSDLNARNISKRTPLMLAASRGNIDTVKQLLAAGADTSLEDVKGWTANDIANSNGHHPLAYIIVEQAMKKVNLKPLSGSLSSVKRNMSASSSASGFHSDQRPFSSSKKIAKESPINLSRLVGGPAVEIDESSSEENSADKVENESSNHKKDIWSMTDDDDSVSMEEVEKPKKINVLQLFNKRRENKSVVAGDASVDKDDNKDVLKIPSQQASNLSNNILEKGHRVYLEKDIDESNSWSISTGSEVSEDHEKDFEEAATKKISEKESVEKLNETSKPSRVMEDIDKKLAQNSVVAPNSPWDSEVSSADPDQNEEQIQDVKKNLMNELGFDEEVESDDLKDSSSDWDSDVEDVESLEKFEIQKVHPGTSKLTFDDEKSLDEEKQEDIKEDYSEKIEDTILVTPAVTAGNTEDDDSKISQSLKKKSIFNVLKKVKDQRVDEEDVPRASRTVMLPFYKSPTIDKNDFRKSSTRSKLPLSSLHLKPLEIEYFKKVKTNKSTDLHSSIDSNSTLSSQKSFDQEELSTPQSEDTKSVVSTVKRSSKDSNNSNSEYHNSKSTTSHKTFASDEDKLPISQSEDTKSAVSTVKRSSKDSNNSNSEYHNSKSTTSHKTFASDEDKLPTSQSEDTKSAVSTVKRSSKDSNNSNSEYHHSKSTTSHKTFASDEDKLPTSQSEDTKSAVSTAKRSSKDSNNSNSEYHNSKSTTSHKTFASDEDKLPTPQSEDTKSAVSTGKRSSKDSNNSNSEYHHSKSTTSHKTFASDEDKLPTSQSEDTKSVVSTVKRSSKDSNNSNSEYHHSKSTTSHKTFASDEDKLPTSQSEDTKSAVSTAKRSSKDSNNSNSEYHNSKSTTSHKTFASDEDKLPTPQSEDTKSAVSTGKRSSKDSNNSNSEYHHSKSTTSHKTFASDEDKLPTSQSEDTKSAFSTVKRSSKDSDKSNSQQSEYYQRKASQPPHLFQTVEPQDIKPKVKLISKTDPNRSSIESTNSSQKSYGYYASKVTSTSSPLSDVKESIIQPKILANNGSSFETENSTGSVDESSDDADRPRVTKIKYSEEDITSIKSVATEVVESNSVNEKLNVGSSEDSDDSETIESNQNDSEKNSDNSKVNQTTKQETLQSVGLNSEVDEPLNHEQIKPSYIINDARETMFEFLKNLTENIKDTLNCPRAIKIILQTEEGDESEVGSIKLEASDKDIRFIPERSDLSLYQKKTLNENSCAPKNICQSCNQQINRLNVSKDVTNKCKKDKPVKKPVIIQNGRIGNFDVQLQVEDGSKDYISDRKPDLTHKHELIKTKQFYSCQSLDDEEEEPLSSPQSTKLQKKQCETYKPQKVVEDETVCSPVRCNSPQSSPKSTNNRTFVDPSIEKRSLKYVMNNLEEAHTKNEKICCELEKIKERNNFLEEENLRQVALIRNLNLELNQIKQNQKNLECEVKAAQQNTFQLTEDLNMERSNSRRLEAESRELLMQLKAADQTLSHVECNRNELRADLERERRKLAVREQVDRSNDEIDRDTTRTKLEILNLMLHDKDTELVKLNAECETLRQTNLRYKSELIQLQQDGQMSDVLTKINTELNHKNEIVTQEKNEAEEAIRHNAIQYKFQMEQLQESLETQMETLNNERKIKEDTLHDLGLLNCQQEALKSSIKELENRLEKENENSATYQQEIRNLSLQRDDYLQKLHKMEINESSRDHELNNIRTNLLMSKNELEQLQNTLEKERKEMKAIEKKLNESNLKNATLDGKIQSYQVEISQMESERLHLKSEVENTRSSESQGLSEQQEKFSNIISAKGREIIELEKTNSMLTQQAQSYEKEIERLRIEKLEKEKELTSAQQDRIEKYKALSFNESTMAQQSELNRILQDEKKKIEEENNLLHQNLQRSYDEMNQLKLEYERTISSSSIKSLQDLENLRLSLNGKITLLQEQLNTSESQYNNLQIKYKQLEIENSGNMTTTKQLQDDSMTLKDKLMNYEDEIRKKEETIKEKEDKIKVFETEVNSHRDTWKRESKNRLRCSADLQRVQVDRDDAIKLCDQYKERWEGTLGESKALQAKSLIQRRKIESLREELESSRRSLSQELQAKEDIEAKYHLEVRKGAEISKSNRIVKEELERNSDRIHQLESMVNELKQNQKQAKKQPPYYQDYPHGDTSEKTFNLTEELKRMKEHSPVRFSPDVSDEVFQNAVNAEVNEKLSSVNAWLRDQARKQETNDKVREEYEIQRRKSDHNKIAELKRELEIEKSKNSFNPLYIDKHVSRDLQKTLRENAVRRDLIKKLDQQNQQTVFYPHNSTSRIDHISSTSVPAFYASNRSWEEVGRAASQPALDVGLLTSTPKNRTNPMIAKAFTKLDESLRKKQNSEQQPNEKLSPSNNNSYLYSNHYSNPYKPK